jgi:hypothetical protein
MADGSKVFVPHPDFITMQPTGRLVFVHTEKGGSHVMDRMLITQIEYQNDPSSEK